MNKSLIISLVAALLLIIFAIQNAEDVWIKFWFWRFQGSQALIIFISVVLGVLISYFFTIPSNRRKNKTISGKDDEIKKLKEQVMNMQHLKPSEPVNSPKA